MLALICALALVWQTTPTGDAQTKSRTRRQRRNAPTKTTTTSTAVQPIAVPRLPPLPKSSATPAPSQTRVANASTQSMPAPQTVTVPAPTPKPSPAAEAIEDDEEVVRVTSNLVVVPASVVNAAGEPVLGLKREDFRLEEEGRAQEIAQVGDADQVPLDIAILFDVSSSVSERYKFQQQAAASFLKEVLKPVDKAAVFSITEKPQLEQALASSEVASAKLLTIPAATRATPTAFYDTVVSAAKYLASNTPGRHRRVILVISDGEDNFSNQIRESSVAEAEALGKAATDAEKERVRKARRASQQALHRKALTEVKREVERADAVFYSINPTGPSLRLNEISTRAQEGMQQLADTTGGNSFVPEKVEDLERVFRQIAAELRSQYLLQYYPNSDAPPGKYLAIKVHAPQRPELRIRARQGYYVAKPK